MNKLLMLPMIAVALAGCQTTQVQQQAAASTFNECYYFGSADKAAPAWICNPKLDKKEYVRSTVGFSGNSAGGIANQKNLAVLQGQKQLADQIKSEIIASIKSKTGTLGVNGSAGSTQATSSDLASVSNVVLEGVETIRTLRGPDGYFYVEMALPQKVLKQNVKNVVKKYQEKAPKKTEVKKVVNSVQENQKLADDITKALSL